MSEYANRIFRIQQQIDSLQWHIEELGKHHRDFVDVTLWVQSKLATYESSWESPSKKTYINTIQKAKSEGHSAEMLFSEAKGALLREIQKLREEIASLKRQEQEELAREREKAKMKAIRG